MVSQICLGNDILPSLTNLCPALHPFLLTAVHALNHAITGPNPSPTYYVSTSSSCSLSYYISNSASLAHPSSSLCSSAGGRWDGPGSDVSAGAGVVLQLPTMGVKIETISSLNYYSNLEIIIA